MLLIPVHHVLVVAVHEVDLHAGDAPLLVEREGLLVGVVAVQRRSSAARARAARLSRAAKRRTSSMSTAGLTLRDVGVGLVELAVPLPVDQLIRPAHVGGELDVFLERGGVHLHVAGPPMVPGHHARLDPRGVRQFAGRGQIQDQVALDQPARLAANHQHAPRRVMRRRGFDQAVAVAARRELRRQRDAAVVDHCAQPPGRQATCPPNRAGRIRSAPPRPRASGPAAAGR